MTAIALVALLAAAQAARPFTIEELLQTRRLDDVQVAQGGKRAAFTVRQKNLAENRDGRDVWMLDLPAGAPRAFTRDGHSDHPRFSPDGKRLLLVSERAGGESQLFVFDLEAGGDGKKLTSFHGGAAEGIWSPDGKLIAFTAEVNPTCAGKTAEVEACTKQHAEERAKNKLKAHLVDRLFYRHWNEWRDQKRTHLFVMPAEGGAPLDLTPGDADWPTWRLGGGGDFSFAADGKTIYVSHKPAKGEAWHTNSDLYAIPTAGGAPRPLTADNPGDDASPLVSPDGRHLAYRAQARDGYESDLWRLRIIDLSTNKHAPLADFGDDAGAMRWKPDSSGLIVEVQKHGRPTMISVSLDGKTAPFSPSPAGGDFAVLADGSVLLIASGMNRPPELYRLPAGGTLQRLSSFNTEQYSGLDLGAAPEEQWIEARDGAKVHSFILKPPGLAKGARAPLVVLVHGGPQGAWEDQWGMRWNPSVYAARGYIVLMPNPRGSSTYGHQFEEQISKDWGGLVYDDVLRSVDAAEKRADVQPGNACAAGASYGGYLVDWIAGHSTRFKCLVSHAGVFDLVSEYNTTEELWFPEFEIGGTYWDNPDAYRKWSPSSYVQAFKTPTLVSLGELDYRVPMEQSFGMFTALQRRGIESKLLDFPDEGHWINKPRNSALFHHTVLDWIDAHLKQKTGPAATAAAAPESSPE